MSKSVKQVVFAVVQNEIDTGRLTLEQLLKPAKWGFCNDYAMITKALAQIEPNNYGPVRSETVLRYIRQYKALKRNELQSK